MNLKFSIPEVIGIEHECQVVVERQSELCFHNQQ